MNRTDDVREFYDKVTSFTAKTKAVPRDKYGTDDAAILTQPLTDCALDSFIRGLPDSMSIMIEARNPKTIEVFKYALTFKTRRQFHKTDYNKYDYSGLC